MDLLILIICIIGVFFLLFIGFTILLIKISKKENKEQSQNFEHFDGGNKKAIVVYHDSPNHTVKKSVEVFNKKLLKMKYSVDNYVARTDLQIDLNNYDVICFAGPIYMGRLATPLFNFIVANESKFKRVIIYANGQFISKSKDLDEVKKFINMTNILLMEKGSGNFKELEKTIEKIEDKKLRPLGYDTWEKIKNERERNESTVDDKK